MSLFAILFRTCKNSSVLISLHNSIFEEYAHDFVPRTSDCRETNGSMNRPSPLSSRSFDQRVSPNDRSSSTSTQSSALRGASLAFQAPPPPAKPLVNTYSGTNGALAAATKAGVGSRKSFDAGVGSIYASPVDAGDNWSSIAGKGAVKKTLPLELGRQEAIVSSQASRQQSPSHIAATLAAARSTPGLSRSETPATSSRKSQRLHPVAPTSPVHNDESSIPATNKLVELFESKHRSTGSPSENRPRSQIRVPQAIVSPIPIRPSQVFRLSPKAIEGNPNYRSPTDSPVKPFFKTPERNAQPSKAAVAAARSASPTKSSPSRTPAKPKEAPTLPPPRRGARPTAIDTTFVVQDRLDVSDSDSTSSYTSARDHFSRTNTLSRTVSIPIPGSTPLEMPTKNVLPTQPPRSKPEPPPILPRRPSSKTPIIRPERPKSIATLSADSLADAIVASSLASSRGPSPAKPKTGPTPPPRRHSKSYSFSLLIPSPAVSRVPSPQKPMRHTLRAEPSSSDEEASHKKHKNGGASHHQHHHHGLLSKKHPNKHAEGDRKRWRDVITERERKRYEGVWAANRGLLSNFAPQSDGSKADSVHALVVKDIWQRSGLSFSILEEIWELVEGGGRRMRELEWDKRGRGRGQVREPWLKREEFVVGLWLVDQCLKGRKLPVEVRESVWGSVKRLMSGVTVR